jgi:GNAT superfamily N-acetyltransferase
MPDSLFVLGQHLFSDAQFDGEPLTLAWAEIEERQRVISLAQQEGRQTMNLRTMPGAKVVVLRRPAGLFAGWAGVDVDTHPRHPEVFSQFVYPQFRNRGLGSLLEHFWWAYLNFRGCGTAYMRMQLDTNQALVERRLRSGYCRRISRDELGERFEVACRKCELFGKACRRQVYLEIDVRKALMASAEARGAFHVGSLPLYIPPKQEVRLPFWAQREVLPVRF